MYFKLSLRNVRKSFSDYTLYFLTLTFGVCVFYVFNSIEAQKAMLQISKSALEIMKSITWLMNGVSVFVSFILGFLIVYANSFLIRRRKKEFGIYMTLGMEKSKISRILVSETLIIGVIALGIGLLGGVFISQGLSVVTAKLFEVNMKDYTFIFSLSALLKTILYFGIIFLIAIAVNTFAITKYKLIDLINADKKNEKQKVKNPIVTWLMFIAAVVLIGIAYKMVMENGIMRFDNTLLFECIMGAVGTFLLFASLSGFLLDVVKANKESYFKGLNMFIMRQINSRINTAHISMSFICLMLFVTIGIFSTGLGMTRVLNMGYKDAAPFDVSVTVEKDADIARALREKGVDLSLYASDAQQYRLYLPQNELTVGTILKSVEDSLPAEHLDTIKKKIYPEPLHLISVSDYNRLLDLQKKPRLNLPAGQFAILSQYIWSEAELQECIENYIKQPNKLTVNGASISVYPKALSDGIVNNSYDIMTIVVPDEVLKGSKTDRTVLCLNCKGDSATAQDEFINALSAARLGFSYSYSSKSEILAQAGGSKAIISFVGIYIGIIFLITSAAVLALQQLSEAADNKRRYAILKKIGADNKLLGRTIFKQTAIYFMIPLAVACIHSVVGIKVANDAIRQVGSLNAGANILITAALILAIYGAYFLATYVGSRNIILRNGTK